MPENVPCPKDYLRMGEHEAAQCHNEEHKSGAHSCGNDNCAPDCTHEAEHANRHLVEQEHNEPEVEEPAHSQAVSNA